jgi:chaperone BCS1
MLATTITQAQQLVGGFNGWIAQALNGNSIIAGAATASIIGSLFFLLRRTPMRLWNYLKRYVIFTYYIDYQPDDSTVIQLIAEKFEHQLQKRVSGKRAMARLITRKKRLTESLGNGGFFFHYEGAWIYISRQQESHNSVGGTNSGNNNTKSQLHVTLSLTTIRLHRQKMLDLLGESAREQTLPGIYQLAASGWSDNTARAYRTRNFTSMPILAIDHTVREKVDAALENFLKHRDKNNREDKSHKLVFLFHGEPGTGKSALSEYIAFKLGTSLFCINGMSSGDRGLIHISDSLVSARENISEEEVPVLLCDDFDTIWNGARKREPRSRNDSEGLAIPEDNAGLGRLLATLQSPTEIRDCVVIFTTNHLEMIDPAVYRPGRVTVLLEIGRMSPKSIMEYYEMSYGQSWPVHTPIERAFRACDVSAFYMQNEDNPQGFVQAVTSVDIAADEAFRSKADVANV